MHRQTPRPAPPGCVGSQYPTAGPSRLRRVPIPHGWPLQAASGPETPWLAVASSAQQSSSRKDTVTCQTNHSLLEPRLLGRQSTRHEQWKHQLPL